MCSPEKAACQLTDEFPIASGLDDPIASGLDDPTASVLRENSGIRFKRIHNCEPRANFFWPTENELGDCEEATSVTGSRGSVDMESSGK